MCERVKASHPLWLPRYAGGVYRWSLQNRELASPFCRGSALVPVPGSARTGDAPWTALELAIVLSEVGFSLPVWIGLRRRHAVTKSATAASAARPSVPQHEEAAYIELRLKLADGLKMARRSRSITQTKLAQTIHSSQSRVAKMEAGDPSVSLDLLVKSLLALGASSRDLAEIIERN
jgi:DNA-binding XRE family transcriptional regulator